MTLPPQWPTLRTIPVAMSSCIFEQMLFGPMAIAELKLPDDNPEAFKTCNEHCNEVSISILPSDIDQAMMICLLAVVIITAASPTLMQQPHTYCQRTYSQF